MVKVILFNGPPGCGKDTVVQHLLDAYPEVFRSQRFALTLKAGLHTLLGLDEDDAAFEDCKDKPIAEFFGRSPRELYIWVSERVMKPAFGDECFGHIWLRKYHDWIKWVPDDENTIVLVPDCGFAPEINPLINHFGAENILLIRIYRQGHDFSSDSRSYITGVLPKELEVVNVNDEPVRVCQQVEHLLNIHRVFADFYEA